ncbi:MAG: TRAP transporter fused permease subunit [Burkholderiaceae bacterium]
MTEPTSLVEPGAPGQAPAGSALRMMMVILGVALAAFSLYTAYYGVFPDMIQRPVHLGLVLVLVFATRVLAPGQAGRGPGRAVSLILLLVSVITMGYHVVFHDEIAARFGEMTSLEFALGLLAIVVLLEATRRSIGPAIVILALIFLLYGYFGDLLPGLAGHRGYSIERMVSQLYLGGGGIFGTPLGVSATFVILIVLFGAVLEQSGASKTLMDIATGLTGRMRGGPAKAAVVGSSLMGMISGTAVANVLTTGTISIPLMRRNGYEARSAGAIEAVASTGGQLMPPVMGAAAFLMADITEIDYLDIAAAALVPALVYYAVLFAVVHFEARKLGISVLERHDLPSVRQALVQGGHLLISMVIFVWLLVNGYSVMYSSFWAVVAGFALSYLRRASWMTPARLIEAAVSAAQAIVPVATACATAGIIIGIITLTGLGLKFSSLVVTVSGGNLLVALILTMIASLVLGMGLPTAAAYILVATLVAPALVELGVNLLAAHLFVFYAAMLSSITPPVALAAYAAAGIAGANPVAIAVQACRFGAAAFIVPFFFAYNPAMLGVGVSVPMVVWAGMTAILGGLSLAAALQGWVTRRLSWPERIAFAAVAALLIHSTWTTDAAGIALLALLSWRQRQAGDAGVAASEGPG